MNPNDLMQPVFTGPVWRCGALSLLLWFLVWWRERPAKSSLPVAVLGLTWAACHLFVSFHSHQFPPKQGEDWLVFGATGLLIAAVAGWWVKPRPLPAGMLSAFLLAAAAWLAFRQLPYLLDRDESSDQRQWWTAAGIGAVVLTFVATEWSARRVSSAALFAGLALFAALCGLALWRMTSPEHMVARPFAAAAVAVGAMIAALGRREWATVPAGAAGWFSGGVVLLLIFGCLSRPRIPRRLNRRAPTTPALTIERSTTARPQS